MTIDDGCLVSVSVCLADFSRAVRSLDCSVASGRTHETGDEHRSDVERVGRSGLSIELEQLPNDPAVGYRSQASPESVFIRVSVVPSLWTVMVKGTGLVFRLNGCVTWPESSMTLKDVFGENATPSAWRSAGGPVNLVSFDGGEMDEEVAVA